MCVFYVSDVLRIILRYLYLEMWLSVFLLIVIEKEVESVNLGVVLNNIYFVLFLCINKLLFMSYLFISNSLFVKVFVIIWELVVLKYIIVLLVYIKIWYLVKIFGRLFINKINSKGFKIDFWGILDVIV